MYRLTVSCHYWPLSEGRLRLRELSLDDAPENFFFSGPLEKSRKRIDLSELSIERRRTDRRRVKCEAELIADLSILDTAAPPSGKSLIFLGHSRDLSATGISLVIPSTQIDEKYCRGTQLIKVKLFLPENTVSMQVRPVRCSPLIAHQPRRGYLLGTEIVSIELHREEFDRFLRMLSIRNKKSV